MPTTDRVTRLPVFLSGWLQVQEFSHLPPQRRFKISAHRKHCTYNYQFFFFFFIKDTAQKQPSGRAVWVGRDRERQGLPCPLWTPHPHHIHQHRSTLNLSFGGVLWRFLLCRQDWSNLWFMVIELHFQPLPQPRGLGVEPKVPTL